eukprot:10878-Prorocentrum_minimum.AAC.1
MSTTSTAETCTSAAVAIAVCGFGRNNEYHSESDIQQTNRNIRYKDDGQFIRLYTFARELRGSVGSGASEPRKGPATIRRVDTVSQGMRNGPKADWVGGLGVDK